MPQFQIAAEREKKARELEKEDAVLMKEYNAISIEYNKKIQDIMAKRNALSRSVYRIRNGIAEGAEDPKKKEIERAKFVRRCTFEGCKGFLSSVWKCGLCSNWVCPECFEVKGTDKDVAHECKPDMLETAKLIKKDTKPCPSCGEMIMKTEGCDQMWCIECHSAFSWKTGRLETGNVHNPHFFE
jgi:hypothetical protein